MLAQIFMLNEAFKSSNGIMRNWEKVWLELDVTFSYGNNSQDYPYACLYTILQHFYHSFNKIMTRLLKGCY